jgi:hypothetical protein
MKIKWKNSDLFTFRLDGFCVTLDIVYIRISDFFGKFLVSYGRCRFNNAKKLLIKASRVILAQIWWVKIRINSKQESKEVSIFFSVFGRNSKIVSVSFRFSETDNFGNTVLHPLHQNLSIKFEVKVLESRLVLRIKTAIILLNPSLDSSC